MLATLPEELITVILSFLHNPPFVPAMRYGDRPQRNIAAFNTLRSVSLTSRQLHRLVEPVLYHSYDGMVHNPSSLQMFLRTLLERPELGEQVRDLNAIAVGVGKVHQLLPQHLARISELGLSDSLATELGSQISEQGDGDADETLLMVLCPNIRRLKFRSRYYDRQQEQGPSLSRQFLEEVSAAHARVTDKGLDERSGSQCDSALTLTDSFRYLTEIDGSYSRSSLREFSGYIPLLRLPALKTFSSRDVVCSDVLFELGDDPLTVQHLDLASATRSTGIKCSALPAVFKRCPALKKLSLTWPTQALGTRYQPLLEASELELLGPVLRDHGSRLEELTLQQCRCVTQFHGALQAAELRSWPGLRELRAPEAMLLHNVGWVEDIPNEPLTECLPSTLEYLEIFGCSTDEHMSFYTDAQIADLVSDDRFTALREVEVWREGSKSVTDPTRNVKQSAVNIASRLPVNWRCEVFCHPYQSGTFMITLIKGVAVGGSRAWKAPEELFAWWDHGEGRLMLADELRMI